MKKKLFLGILSLFAATSLASCGGEEAENKPTPTPSVEPSQEQQYFDVPATEIDHYFSDKINFAQTGTSIKKNADGKYEGSFIKDKVAKLKLKSVTDGDTAVFHLNGSERDTYTVPGKTYSYVTVRFFGIDTPESTSSIQPWGKAAAAYGKNLLTTAEGIIIDASDLNNDNNYANRVDSNGTRWLGLVWYCPQGKDPENLENYRCYQLDMIEECYTFAASFSTDRFIYTADEATEPILYNRYYTVRNSITGESEYRFGSMTINELFFEAENRMNRTGSRIRIQGETDPNYDYNTTPVSMSIKEAKENINELMTKGTFVELKGVITRFVTSNLYIQDENGEALYIYMGIDGNTISGVFNVGDTIKIRGRLCEYGGQYQMSGVEFKRETFTKVTDPNEIIPMPEPIKLTGNETTEDLDALIGKLVTTTITCNNIGSQSKDGSFSLTSSDQINNFKNSQYIEYSEDYIQVRINGLLAPGYEYTSFKEGSKYEVTGILSIYKEDDYQKEVVLPSYQITPGNRQIVNGEPIDEVKLVN